MDNSIHIFNNRITIGSVRKKHYNREKHYEMSDHCNCGEIDTNCSTREHICDCDGIGPQNCLAQEHICMCEWCPEFCCAIDHYNVHDQCVCDTVGPEKCTACDNDHICICEWESKYCKVIHDEIIHYGDNQCVCNDVGPINCTAGNEDHDCICDWNSGYCAAFEHYKASNYNGHVFAEDNLKESKVSIIK